MSNWEAFSTLMLSPPVLVVYGVTALLVLFALGERSNAGAKLAGVAAVLALGLGALYLLVRFVKWAWEG